MHLLNAKTGELREFPGRDAPVYVALSHRWGDDEISFAEMSSPTPKIALKSGFKKIEACCRVAASWPIEWVWIDTCCINKASSADLSEAINSMFRWYERADICFAYLDDVEAEFAFQGSESLVTDIASLKNSKWFTRGWTLQELLAPRKLYFFDKNWKSIGTKFSLRSKLQNITGISEAVLTRSRPLSRVPIAQRMSWAASRHTTRPEDIAYCLLGIFDVSMPLLYGEGSRKAFLRLQEEILKYSTDHTIFAWEAAQLDDKLSDRERTPLSGLLAAHPRFFLNAAHFKPFQGYDGESLLVSSTNAGLSLQLHVHIDADFNLIAILNCCESGDEERFAYIHLYAVNELRAQFCRTNSEFLGRGLFRGKPRQIYIQHAPALTLHEAPMPHWIRPIRVGWHAGCSPLQDKAETMFETMGLSEIGKRKLLKHLDGEFEEALRSDLDDAPESRYLLPLFPDKVSFALRAAVPPFTAGEHAFQLVIGRKTNGTIGTCCFVGNACWQSLVGSQNEGEPKFESLPVIYRLPQGWRLAVDAVAMGTSENPEMVLDTFGNSDGDSDSNEDQGRTKETTLLLSLIRLGDNVGEPAAFEFHETSSMYYRLKRRGLRPVPPRVAPFANQREQSETAKFFREARGPMRAWARARMRTSQQ